MRRKKGDPTPRRERHPQQGGGPFTKTAPRVRRKRRHGANKVAKTARKVNR